MLNTHGGDIYSISEKYGYQKEELLDYSANLNPLGMPKDLREKLLSQIDSLMHYPDMSCRELVQEIACYIRIEKECIVVGNGALEIIFLAFDLLRPKHVLIPAPTFSEYEKAAKRVGAKVTYFERKEPNGFKLELTSLLKAMEDGVDALLLCNPNNPTSTLESRENIIKVLEKAKNKGIAVIIDETFIELTLLGNANSVSDLVQAYDNLFVVRAFTKLFAIPGLRLGYGIGNERWVQKMWERKLPWSVNALAGAIGSVLRDETGYMKKTAEWLNIELEYFYAALCDIKSLKVYKPSTNFVLVRIVDEEQSVELIVEKAAMRGLLLRNASNFTYLDDSYFRIAIRDRESNKKALKILKEIL